jgi:hypothetical protein
MFNEWKPHPKPEPRQKKAKKPLPKRSKKNKPPTAEQKRRWDKIVALGCMVNNWECSGRITIHHAETGGGGVKDHDKVFPLCCAHHTSHEYGIDGRGEFSKKTWQEHYNTEQYYLDKVKSLLII